MNKLKNSGTSKKSNSNRHNQQMTYHAKPISCKLIRKKRAKDSLASRLEEIQASWMNLATMLKQVYDVTPSGVSS